MELTGFTIIGLHGRFNVEAKVEHGCLILVGPNGTGKSTIINILYFALTRQWARLLDWKFEQVVLKFGHKHVAIDQRKIFESKEITTHNSGALIRRYTTALIDAGQLDKFLSQQKLSLSEQKNINKTTGLPISEISRFRDYMRENIFTFAAVDLDRAGAEITKLYPLKTIFLPTYRRIEKDLKSVIPDFEEKYRSRVDAERFSGRKPNHFVELVNFGMEDVATIFEKVSRELRDYARSQVNTLSITYLKDIIRSNVSHFSRNELEEFTEEAIDEAVSKVDDRILTQEDKRLLRRRLYEIKTKSGPLTESDEFLAHYAHKLVQAAADISKKEAASKQFVNMVASYLDNKVISYDQISFDLTIKETDSGQPLNLGDLSSGEKQVVSLLSHIFLEQGDPFALIIDEPELSLSVSWQTRFLPDILTSDRCKMLLAVTHSPFIIDNELQKYAVDVRRIISRV